MIKTILSNKIIRASIGLLTITLLAKVLGYTEKLVLAKYYGTSGQVDVYTLVLSAVMSIFYFFREVVEPGFLSTFLKAKSNKDDNHAWDIFNFAFRFILILTLLASICSILYPQAFSAILAPGFTGEKLSLAQQMLQIALPASIFLGLSTLTSITLNGLKQFVLPASGELVFKAGIILGMVLLYNRFGVIGAAIGMVVGALGRFLLHLTKLYTKINFRKNKLNAQTKKHIWFLTWPLLLGVSFSQLSSLLDNVFASYLPEGSIAALGYAKKLVELPVVLFPYVLSIVVFPYFTTLAVEKNTQKLQMLLAGSLKWIVVVFVPLSIFFVFYAQPIIETVFQRGAFDSNSTIITKQPFMIYSAGLVFFAIETILVIFYFANSDTKTPVFVGMACVVLNVSLTWILIKPFGYLGIAWAYVIQKIVKNILLLYLIKRKVSYPIGPILKFLLKICIPTLIYSAVILLIKNYFVPKEGLGAIKKMLWLAIPFASAALTYLSILYLEGFFKNNKNTSP